MHKWNDEHSQQEINKKLSNKKIWNLLVKKGKTLQNTYYKTINLIKQNSKCRNADHDVRIFAISWNKEIITFYFFIK